MVTTYYLLFCVILFGCFVSWAIYKDLQGPGKYGFSLLTSSFWVITFMFTCPVINILTITVWLAFSAPAMLE